MSSNFYEINRHLNTFYDIYVIFKITKEYVMDSTRVLLGKKIRELRKKNGWTQEYLSEIVGINSKSILRIEAGKTFPTYQNLEKFAEIFGIEVADLFNNRSLADVDYLKKFIYDNIENLDDNKIRSLYNFLYAII